MLFYIDRSVYDVMRNRKLTPEERQLFQDLSYHRQHGNCAICGDLNSLRALRDTCPPGYNAAYSAAFDKYSEQLTLIQAVDWVFVLTLSDSLSLRDLPPFLKEKGYIIYCSRAYAWTELGNVCTLLGEDLYDCKFYEIVGKNYCRRKGIRGLEMSFHSEQGGGVTTAAVLEKCCLKDARPTLCVVDSDRRYGPSSAYPGDPSIGETLNKVQHKAKQLRQQIPHFPFEVLPLYVHEAENLIPLSVLDAISKTHPNMCAGVQVLKLLSRLDNGSPLLYYDLKKGQEAESDETNNWPIERRTYWEEVKERLAQEGHQNVKFVPAHCGRILEEAGKYILEANTAPEEPFLSLWDQLGQRLLSWGCVSKPIRA